MRKFFTLFAAVLASLSMWANITWTAPQSTDKVDYYMTMDDGQSLLAFKNKTGSQIAPEEQTDKWCVKTSNSGGFWIVPAEDVTKITISYLCTSTNSSDTKYKVQTANFGTDLNSAESVTFAVKSGAEKNTWFDAEITVDVAKDQHIYIKFPTNVYISEVVLTTGAKCTAPAEPLVLTLDTTKNQGEGLYVGDKVKFTISGKGSEAEISLEGKDGEEIVSNEWTATAGEHTFVLSQDDKDGVCGVNEEIKLVVAKADKVESAVVSGEATVVIGKEVTLTCSAENATNFQWFKADTKIDGATEAEYKFTPDAAGELSFACEAWNKFNTDADHAKSAAFKVTVTEVPVVCGELAKVEVKSASEATLTGEFEGTTSVGGLKDEEGKKSEYEGKTGYKLNSKDSHVGVTFTEGTLKAEDVVKVFVTKVSDAKKLQIFSDKGQTLIAETDQLELGENTFVLDDRAEGGTGVFVYRVLGGTEGAAYNAHIAYFTVERECETSEPSLKVNPASVTLAATLKNEGKAEAKVTFSGKNLAKGEYDLVLTEVAGLSVSPKKVTVGDDGKLSAEVTLTFESAEDVDAAAAELSLKIGELSQKVAITYSATVTAPCGEIIKAVHKNKNTAEVSGTIGGTADKNTQDGGKLGSNGHFFGIKLAEGNFLKGDKLTIHATTTSTIVQIFSDKGETMLNEGTFDADGIYLYKLEAETEWIYLYRTTEADKTMNPTVDYMSVTRPCHEESSDATIKSLKINDQLIEAKENLYAFQLAADYKEDDVTIAFELNDEHATADKEKSFKHLAPETSEDTVRIAINVTAEDGTKAQYKIEITRAEAPKNTDATIKELKIQGKTIEEKETVFAYEVPAEENLAEVEVTFVLNDEKAKADKESPFKVAVPESSEAAASEAAIVVTAEDGTTTKTYKVVITRGTAEQGIENIQTSEISNQKIMLDGQLYIIKNGVIYNAQGAIVK